MSGVVVSNTSIVDQACKSGVFDATLGACVRSERRRIHARRDVTVVQHPSVSSLKIKVGQTLSPHGLLAVSSCLVESTPR